jgi:superfamily I DNA/RNA helicase
VKSFSNVPLRYIKNISLETINSDSKYNSFYESMKNCYGLIDDKQARCVNNLVCDIEAHYVSAGGEDTNTFELFTYIMGEMGLLEYFKSLDNKNSFNTDKGGRDSDQMFNLEVLATFTSKYSNPKDFLYFVEQMRNKAKEDNKKEISERKGIHLMTIHSSKGLEYDNVVVAGMCTRTMPFHMSNGVEERKEERRLAYVAVTRPKSKLYMSAITEKFGRYNVRPSPYIHEATK